MDDVPCFTLHRARNVAATGGQTKTAAMRAFDLDSRASMASLSSSSSSPIAGHIALITCAR
ncbi:hypothetical protein AKJ09_10396 [Labilithrix luteola]|uniref:Uncharacterized protein n=1 Tax=Labilithrix luteola TaxID=1391654 RepID=A0A0K1QDE4_9BACT|nr:hypothetical protein AKJ09_10396 [Labilithrix luteola]